jgi:hypothetical protein
MKTKITMLLSTVFGTAAIVVGQVVGLPIARVNLHIIDENNLPVSGAQIKLGFIDSSTHQENAQSGLTDNQGLFSAQGPCNGILGCEISKNGYYNGWPSFSYFYTIKDGHWQPWDQTYTTVFRKVGNPIAMYAKKVGAKIPAAINEHCGFDLEAADWVAPYGNGQVADFSVTVTNLQYTSDNDSNASATITFPNDGDGIQETQLPAEFAQSVFKWPRQAPDTGYQPKLEAHRLWVNPRNGQTQSVNTANENQAYFFRVRTVMKDGHIISALYGKIQGGVFIGPNKGQNGIVGFTYYLNPTPNDRNMEFDPNQNLFKNLPYQQRIRAP